MKFIKNHEIHHFFHEIESSNGQKCLASSRLTVQRLVSEMTRTFGPVWDQKCSSVIEKRCPYRKSPRKVFPFLVSLTVSKCVKTVMSDWWASWFKHVLTKPVINPLFAALRESEVFRRVINTEITGISVFSVFSEFSGIDKTVILILVWEPYFLKLSVFHEISMFFMKYRCFHSFVNKGWHTAGFKHGLMTVLTKTRVYDNTG